MLYNIVQVLGNTHKPLPVKQLIHQVIAGDPACWENIEPYMLPPGKEGSIHFDHAMVVVALRKADKRGLLVDKDGVPLTGRDIFIGFSRWAKDHRFQIRHGRIDGVLEDMSAKSNASENGNDLDQDEAA